MATLRLVTVPETARHRPECYAAPYERSLGGHSMPFREPFDWSHRFQVRRLGLPSCCAVIAPILAASLAVEVPVATLTGDPRNNLFPCR